MKAPTSPSGLTEKPTDIGGGASYLFLYCSKEFVPCFMSVDTQDVAMQEIECDGGFQATSLMKGARHGQARRQCSMAFIQMHVCALA